MLFSDHEDASVLAAGECQHMSFGLTSPTKMQLSFSSYTLQIVAEGASHLFLHKNGCSLTDSNSYSILHFSWWEINP